jgi:hypothetical protein
MHRSIGRVPWLHFQGSGPLPVVWACRQGVAFLEIRLHNHSSSVYHTAPLYHQCITSPAAVQRCSTVQCSSGGSWEPGHS